MVLACTVGTSVCSLPASPCDNPGDFVIDYSDGSGAPLDEAALFESDNLGRGSVQGAYADWNLNGVLDTTAISIELNEVNGVPMPTLSIFAKCLA